MSERALELLALPKDGVPKLLLDLGLSGETITQNGHRWIGLDISTSMNNIALEREVAGYFILGDMGQGLEFRLGMFDGAVGISTVQLELIGNAALDAGFGGRIVVDHLGSRKKEKRFLVLTCGVANTLLAKREDEGEENKRGLEFRLGMFNGAIGISTIQWLCNAVKSCHNPDPRLKCLTIGARVVFPLNAESSDQLKLIGNAALRAGFTGNIGLDYLVLTCVAKRKDEGEENKRASLV